MTTPPVIALHMIVRDEADTIAACLDSVLPHVDRAMIHDTGSSDATPTLIEAAFTRHGYDDTRSAIRRVEWPGGFGDARQACLTDTLQAWPDVTHVVWVDGDDVIVGAEGLRYMAGELREPDGALLVHYAYATDPAGNLACSHFRERLIRVDAIQGWEGAVHEVLTLKPGWRHAPAAAPEGSGLAGLTGNTWPTGQGGIEIRHQRPPGKDTTGRNLRILEAQDQAARDAGAGRDPRTLFYLAQEYAIRGAIAKAGGDDGAWRDDLRLAIRVLEEYDALSGWDQERYQARHRRADFLRALGDHHAALRVDLDAVSLLPDWPDAWHGAAESYLHTGNPAAALHYTDAGLAKPYPQSMLILNPLDYTASPYVTRALALHALGRPDEALADITRAHHLMPYDDGVAHNHALFAEHVNRRRIKDAVLALDEALARHDENLKAAALLEDAVPYFLVDDPDIADRRRRRRQGVRHVRGGDYTRFYGVDNPVHPIEDSIGGGRPFLDAIRGFCARLPRAQFLHRMLQQRATELGRPVETLRVVDVGCNDGWLGWWLTTTVGVASYTGYDLSEEAILVAQGYRTREGLEDAATRTAFHVGTGAGAPEADVVVCFEVLEHVPDAAEHLRFLAGLAGPGGLVVISTPNGAWERGHIPDWNTPEPRGHVRALRPNDVASLLLDQGVLQGLEETDDRLVVAAFTPAPRHGRLDMYLGGAAGVWSPLDPVTKGLGGSETMAVRMATQLADRGWRVRVYGEVTPQTVAQVEYLPHHLFDPTTRRDVLVASRTPWLIREQPEAARRILWLHDADYPGLEGLAPLWDEVWTVGRWQADHLPTGDADVRVTRNGIPLDRYQGGSRGFHARRPALIYSSCPSRGLTNILDAWDEILAGGQDRGVDPELHIAYGFTDLWRAHEQVWPDRRLLRERVEGMVNAPGVRWHGGISQPRLAELQQDARVWWYPTDFPEVSCITGMEAQAAGLAIVTSDVAELPHTVGAAGDLFPPPADWTDAVRARVVSRVVDLLTEEGVWEEAHRRSLAGAGRYGITELGAMWDAWLRQTTARPALAAA